MRRSRIAALLLGALLIAGRVASNPAETNGDASRIEGVWEIQSVEREGKPETMHVGATLTFDKSVVSFKWRMLSVDELAKYPAIQLVDDKALARLAMS